jgi:hypothetical protein
MAQITVPNVVGLGRGDAEKKLDEAHLRYIAVLPQGPGDQALATTQSPAPGTLAGEWTIVTVTYPSIFGPLPDSSLQGQVHGTLQGKVAMVGVGPKGGAYVDLLTTDAARVGLVLFGSDPWGPAPGRRMGEAGRGAGLGPKRDDERSRRHGCCGGDQDPEDRGLEAVGPDAPLPHSKEAACTAPIVMVLLHGAMAGSSQTGTSCAGRGASGSASGMAGG